MKSWCASLPVQLDLEAEAAMQQIKLNRLEHLSVDIEPNEQKLSIQLFCSPEKSSEVRVEAGQRAAVSTGISVELPQNIEGQVTISNTLANYGALVLLNSPATIDPDYRGEIIVIVKNISDHVEILHAGAHIADMRFRSFVQATFLEVTELGESPRGFGGLGSTGVK